MRLVSISRVLFVGAILSVAARGQFRVTTSALASANALASGTLTYDGTTASQSINQSQGGTVTDSNAPNTPNLTEASSQITASDAVNSCVGSSCVTGTQIASALASAESRRRGDRRTIQRQYPGRSIRVDHR